MPQTGGEIDLNSGPASRHQPYPPGGLVIRTSEARRFGAGLVCAGQVGQGYCQPAGPGPGARHGRTRVESYSGKARRPAGRPARTVYLSSTSEGQPVYPYSVRQSRRKEAPARAREGRSERDNRHPPHSDRPWPVIEYNYPIELRPILS